MNKVDKDISIVGGLKLIDTLPKKGKVNRGILYIDNKNVIGMEEILDINVENKNYMDKLKDKIANVNFIGLQNNALEGIFYLNTIFKEKNKGNKSIESLLPTHLNDLLIGKTNHKIKMEYFLIKNKIVGITNPGDDLILKDLINNSLL